MNLAACALFSRSPETGVWYRAIQPQFWPTALATLHTRVTQSRFNEGANAQPQFEILYLSENQMVALFEAQALFGLPTQAGGVIANPLQPWSVLNVNVRLQDVVDLTQISSQNLLGSTAQELTGDWRGYQQRSSMTPVSQPVGTAPTQTLGAALYAVTGLEGFITISAKLPYHRNLVVFPQKLKPGSQLTFIFTDPSGQIQTYTVP